MIDRVTGPKAVHNTNNHNREMIKGSLFRGRVVEIGEDHAVINVNGQRVRAKSHVPLSKNEVALFQVKDNKNGVLVLTKVGTTDEPAVSQDLSSIIKELGFTESELSRKVVQHFLDNKLMLEKPLLEQIMRDLQSLPQRLHDNYIKAQAWLYAANILGSNLHKTLLSMFTDNEQSLKLIDGLVKFLTSMQLPDADISPELGEQLLTIFYKNLRQHEAEIGEENSELKELLLNLLVTQRSINQSIVDNPHFPQIYYFPIPMKLFNTNMSAELYLLMEDKATRGFEKETSLIFSVATEKLGKIWFDIKYKNKSLNINIYTESPGVTEYIKNTSPLLLDRLNFHVQSFNCVTKKFDSVFELINNMPGDFCYRAIDTRV